MIKYCTLIEVGGPQETGLKWQRWRYSDLQSLKALDHIFPIMQLNSIAFQSYRKHCKPVSQAIKYASVVMNHLLHSMHWKGINMTIQVTQNN